MLMACPFFTSHVSMVGKFLGVLLHVFGLGLARARRGLFSKHFVWFFERGVAVTWFGEF